MRVVITGGTGFLGTALAEELLRRGRLAGGGESPEPIDEIVLADASQPREGSPADPTVSFVQGDLSDDRFVADLFGGSDALTVFHLAAVVSAQAEQDFNLAMRVNLDSVRGILETLRHRAGPARFVSTSSVAVFGSDIGEIGREDAPLRPESTYGMTKAVLELLTSEYSRKGYLDGRIARLPTVIIRPGAANAAASSAASAVFREPLAGRDYVLPLPETTTIAVAGVDSVIAGILALHDLPSERLGLNRIVTLPSRSVSFADMIATLRAESDGRRLGRITVEPDAAIRRIVESWPAVLESRRAEQLGIPDADELPVIVRQYLARTGSPSAPTTRTPSTSTSGPHGAI
jgi:nucleoside-diphosphate-sugar epimerase